MKKLIELKTREINKEKENKIKELNKIKIFNSYKDLGYFSYYLPNVISNRVKSLKGISLKNYIKNRIEQFYNKKLKREIDEIESIFNAPDVIEGVIKVEWKKSRKWGGENPTAVIRVKTSNGYDIFSSGSIGGAGYDKESTSVAKVLNQCKGLLKEMYKIKENHPRTHNHKLFGYGSGYDLLPYFEDGVGTSAYYSIFNEIGYKFENTGSGQAFAIYTFTKK